MDYRGRIPGQYIVRFKSDVSDVRGITDAALAAGGGRAIKVLTGLKGFWGELPDTAVEALRRNPNGAYIEADAVISAKTSGPGTQYYPNWRLDRIDQRYLPLNQEFEYPADGTGVRIWIVDQGVDRNTGELSGRVDESWWATYDGLDPYAPVCTHGTNMAIAAAGSTSGVAKNATVHSARVADCDGVHMGAAVAAFEFIDDYSPKPAVINYSNGHECTFFGCWQTVDDAAKYARDPGRDGSRVGGQ
jgi:hypothetical protein